MILEQKRALQEEVLEKKTQQTSVENSQLRTRIEELEKENARLQATDETNHIRVNQFKEEYDKLYEKYKKLAQESEEKGMTIERLKKEMKRVSQKELDDMRAETSLLKANSEKERVLYEMEKKYMQE